MKKNSIIILLVALAPSLVLGFDCQFCSDVDLNPTEETGPPWCQSVEYSSANPYCEDVGDSEVVALAAPETCVFPEGYTANVHFTISQGSGDGYSCFDFQVVDEGDYEVPQCVSWGHCLIYV